VNNIPDDLMRECLEKCSLRLTTHPELRDAYRRKFGLPTWILPAVVPAHLVATRPVALAPVCGPAERRGALLGSFWDQSWFNRLCDALEPSKYTIDWFGQNHSPWLEFPLRHLKRAGIRPLGILPEEQLAGELRKYPFVIVPSGALDPHDRNVAVAAFSLPGRILFAVAASHTPILIVGSERTCGARFVRHFGIGTVAPYESGALAAAMAHLVDPRVQESMRKNAAAIASRLSDDGLAAWLDASLEKGQPADPRFEDLFSGYNAA
jgi:glutamate-1-semialdehyde 2,1-aminomutase